MLYKFLLTSMFITACQDVCFGAPDLNDPHKLTKLVLDGTKVILDAGQQRRDLIEQNLEQLSQQKIALGKKRDSRMIGDAEYQAQCAVVDNQIKRLERQIEQGENLGTKTVETVQEVLRSGMQVFFKNQEEQETRKTVVAQAAVTKALDNEGAMARLEHITDLVTDPKKMVVVGSFVVLTTGGAIASDYGLTLAYRYLQTLLDTPVLVDESSRQSRLDVWKEKIFGPQDPPRDLDDIILNSTVEKKIRALADDVRSNYVNKLPMRNLLLYGPPGTGKTMIARALAHFSGMDYALTSGANFSKFAQGDDVTQLQILFDWAERSEKGLILFIDEVDAFAKRRDQSEDRWVKLLNAFLARTGSISEKIMIVGATNNPGMLDDAFMSRMHKKILVPLPQHDERVRLLELYLKKYISDDQRTILKDGAKVAARIAVAPEVNDAVLKKIVARLDGFSGRDIAVLIDEVRAACYRSKDLTLTPDLFEKIVQEKLVERAEEACWK
jgi:ATPase family AAA domain-containing protein 3A/B